MLPTNLEECFKVLKDFLSADDLAFIKKNHKNVSALHHTLGRKIRNEWGLWSGSELKQYFEKLNLPRENRYRIDHYSNARKTFVVDMLYMIDSKSDSEELKYSIIKNREPKSLKEGWNITNATDIFQLVVAGGMTCKKCNTFNEYVTTPNQLDNSYVCYGCRSGF